MEKGRLCERTLTALKKRLDSNGEILLQREGGKIRRLKCSFNSSIERVILAQGSLFWDWSMYTAENYYRTRH